MPPPRCASSQAEFALVIKVTVRVWLLSPTKSRSVTYPMVCNEPGDLFVVENATRPRQNAERVVGHSPTMSPSLSLPRQLIDMLFNEQLPHTLSPALREQLKIRPPRPSRGLTSHLISIFLTRPYTAQLLLQRVLPLFRRITDFGPVAFYEKHRDVRDILDRDDDFPSGPTIGPGLVSGDFILGM